MRRAGRVGENHTDAVSPVWSMHVAAALSAVQRGSGQGERCAHRGQLPHGLPPRIAEDSARVAEPALSDGQVGAAAFSVAAAHRAVVAPAR